MRCADPTTAQVVVYLCEYYLQGDSKDHLLFWGHSHHNKGVRVDQSTRAELKLAVKQGKASAQQGDQAHNSIVSRCAAMGESARTAQCSVGVLD